MSDAMSWVYTQLLAVQAFLSENAGTIVAVSVSLGVVWLFAEWMMRKVRGVEPPRMLDTLAIGCMCFSSVTSALFLWETLRATGEDSLFAAAGAGLFGLLCCLGVLAAREHARFDYGPWLLSWPWLISKMFLVASFITSAASISAFLENINADARRDQQTLELRLRLASAATRDAEGGGQSREELEAQKLADQQEVARARRVLAEVERASLEVSDANPLDTEMASTVRTLSAQIREKSAAMRCEEKGSTAIPGCLGADGREVAVPGQGPGWQRLREELDGAEGRPGLRAALADAERILSSSNASAAQAIQAAIQRVDSAARTVELASAALAGTQEKIDALDRDKGDARADARADLAKVEEADVKGGAMITSLARVTAFVSPFISVEEAEGDAEWVAYILALLGCLTLFAAECLAQMAGTPSRPKRVHKPRQRQPWRGLWVELGELMQWVGYGEAATAQARLEAAEEAAEKNRIATEVLHNQQKGQIGSIVTTALAQARSEMEGQVAALERRYKAELEAAKHGAGDPLKTGFIDERNWDQALAERLKELMHSDDLRHRRVMGELKPATHVDAMRDLYEGKPVDFDAATPRNAAAKYVKLWNAAAAPQGRRRRADRRALNLEGTQ